MTDWVLKVFKLNSFWAGGDFGEKKRIIFGKEKGRTEKRWSNFFPPVSYNEKVMEARSVSRSVGGGGITK